MPLWEPDLTLDDTEPFRLSRNHFIIEVRVEGTLDGPLRDERPGRMLFSPLGWAGRQGG